MNWSVVAGSLGGAVAIHVVFLACSASVRPQGEALGQVVDGGARTIACAPDALFCEGNTLLTCTHGGTDAVAPRACEDGRTCGTAHCAPGVAACCASATPICEVHVTTGLAPSGAADALVYADGEYAGMVTCGSEAADCTPLAYVHWHAVYGPILPNACSRQRLVEFDLPTTHLPADTDITLADAVAMGAVIVLWFQDPTAPQQFMPSRDAGGTLRYTQVGNRWTLTFTGTMVSPLSPETIAIAGTLVTTT